MYGKRGQRRVYRWRDAERLTEEPDMNTSNSAAGEQIAGPDAATAELLDVRQVAAMLGASVRHIYRLADAGKMPSPVRLGALVRWPRQAVLSWIAAGCPSVRSTKGGHR